MSKFISFDRKICISESVFLPGNSSAALYGKGIYTTIAIDDSTPFLWEKHWKRLTENAMRVSLDVSVFSEEETKNALLEIVEKNNLVRGRARLTFFDASAPLIWANNAPPKTNLLIQTAEFRGLPEHLRLTVSPFRVNSKSPLVNVKSCNYLENILAFEDAKAKGFNEAIRLNEKDEIASACMANVFWRKNDTIFTPNLKTGCLSGTTREFFMENNQVEETEASLKELHDADEIFLTSAGIGIIGGSIEINLK